MSNDILALYTCNCNKWGYPPCTLQPFFTSATIFSTNFIYGATISRTNNLDNLCSLVCSVQGLMSKKVVVAGILGLAESKSSVYVLLRATVHCLWTGFLIN